MLSNLPPGVTDAMIERQFGDGPCDICGQHSDVCVCPECPICGDYGNPKCYRHLTQTGNAVMLGHGLKLTPEQVLAHEKAKLKQLEEDLVEQRIWIDQLAGIAQSGEFNAEDYMHILPRAETEN